MTVTLKANQNVTGLTLTIFGTGLAALIGENLLAGGSVSVAFSEELKAAFGGIRIPVLADIPYIGPLLFSNNIFVIIGVVCAVAMGLYLNHTRRGLNLRAVGENPGAADAAGVNVALYKYVHILWAAASVAWAAATSASSPATAPGCRTASTAWAGSPWRWSSSPSWSPYRAILGSLIFGALSVLQFYKPAFPARCQRAHLFMLALPW